MTTGHRCSQLVHRRCPFSMVDGGGRLGTGLNLFGVEAVPASPRPNLFERSGCRCYCFRSHHRYHRHYPSSHCRYDRPAW